MLLRQGGQTYAIMATCSHIGGPLDEGQIEGDTVTCPWHGSVFCVRDGALIHGPATVSQPAFDVQVQNGRIAVRAQEAS
jgi:nitrite reductase/ring-hydroxylating ferredoxin subunit